MFGEEPNQTQTIEKSLLDQNKKLENQIVFLKVSILQTFRKKSFQQLFPQNEVQEKEKQAENLSKKVTRMEESLQTSQSLVQKLEQDLNQNDPKNSDDEFDFLAKPPPQSGENNLLGIVRNQRDRFGKKIQELELENGNLVTNLETFRTEIDGLRKDNLSLYEKVRYLSSYSNQPIPETGVHAEDSEMNPYEKEYEESVHPFAVFSRREKHQRVSNLNPAEKVIYTSSQFFLSSKETRFFLFFYSLSLHLLVFWCLYRLMTIDAEQH